MDPAALVIDRAARATTRPITLDSFYKHKSDGEVSSSFVAYEYNRGSRNKTLLTSSVPWSRCTNRTLATRTDTVRRGSNVDASELYKISVSLKFNNDMKTLQQQRPVLAYFPEMDRGL